MSHQQTEAMMGDLSDEADLPLAADGDQDQLEPASENEIETVTAVRPTEVPEKFWDAKCGAVRTDSLLKSYLELERKLGAAASPSEPVDPAAPAAAPVASPDQYQIEAAHDLLQPDPAINTRLHEAGFSNEQAQMVYDLAAEHLLPLLEQSLAEVESERERERLVQHFGGGQAWRATSHQIKTWGQATLPADVFETLASSYDGVLAMHQMMRGREPAVLRDAGSGTTEIDKATLSRLMRDPRYWRDREPSFVQQVTSGFQQLYQD